MSDLSRLLLDPSGGAMRRQLLDHMAQGFDNAFNNKPIGPKGQAAIILQCLEIFAYTTIPAVIETLTVGHMPEAKQEFTPDQYRFAALLLHNLILRDPGQSLRATIEQTSREYEVRYRHPSDAATRLLQAMKGPTQ